MADLDKNQMLLSEVLQKVSNAKTKAQKIKILKDFRTDALVSILIWNYDTSVKSMIPEGEVPYKVNDAPIGTEHTRLIQDYRKLFHFVKGGNDSLNRSTRERMFIQMLEGLSSEEAHLICLVKDKNLQKKYKVTKACIDEAYPDIEWGNRS
jgi:hypothetical protein|tara:strand:+ start:654 stop:1106 length:453 start_codon:yes stop_codon:yes gene_type:complete